MEAFDIVRFEREQGPTGPFQPWQIWLRDLPDPDGSVFVLEMASPHYSLDASRLERWGYVRGKTFLATGRQQAWATVGYLYPGVSNKATPMFRQLTLRARWRLFWTGSLGWTW